MLQAGQNARWLAVVLIAFSFVSSSQATDVDLPVSDGPAAGDLLRPDWIQEGKARFVRTCAYCHGQEGEAGKTRPFKTRIDWSPQDIFDTISNGRVRGGNVMPTWKGAIPPAEIWKLVAYIKSLPAAGSGAASQ